MARDGTLDRARHLARAGALDEAAALCRAVLAADPGSVRARRLHGGVLRALGRPEDGLAELLRAQATAPDDVELQHDLGGALTALGRHAEAADAYLRVTSLRPAAAGAWNDLAGALLALGRPGDALAASDRAVAAQPADARVQVHRAAALRALGRHADAVAAYRLALAPRPDDVSLLLALGRALQALGRHGEAVAVLERLLVVAPDLPAAHADLGNALQELDRYREAEAAFGRALALDPGLADVHYGLANTLMMDGRAAAAVAAFDRALALRPDHAEWRFNRGHALLALGRLDAAWADLDGHWRRQRRRTFDVPEWDGRPLAGRLLVWGDQGLGDEVLACGLLREAAARVGELVVESDRRLVPVLRRSLPGIVVVGRADPPAGAAADGLAAHLPMTGLPGILRRHTADFPSHDGYLLPDPDRVAALRARYRAAGPALVVGLSWRSANRVVGARKSFGLPGWAPVLRVPGVRFVSLQYGEVAADVAAAEAATGTAILVDPAVDALADLDGFAAQVAAMDLVITVSNSTAHVAGATGRPCWLMLPSGNGLLWHWVLCKGEACPWYPAIRVFRQDREEAWPGVMAQVGKELRHRSAA